MSRTASTRGVRPALNRIQRGLEERRGWWGRLLEQPLLWAAVVVVGCTWLLLPRSAANLPTWASGDVATFDVVVPRDMSLPDEAATEAVREEARAEVLPVYDFEPRLRVELSDGVHELFTTCRTYLAEEEGGDRGGEAMPPVAELTELQVDEAVFRVFRSAECSDDLEIAVVDVIAQVYRALIVDDARELERRGEQGVTLRNLASGTERVVPLEELSSVIDLRSGLELALRARLLEQDAVARRWIKPMLEFLDANLVPNLVLNRAETAQRVQRAADRVAPRSQVLQRGQILIRRGDTVTPRVAQTLRVMSERQEELTFYSTSLGIGLLVVLMAFGWWRILARFTGEAERRHHLSMIFLLMLLFVALTRLGLYLAEAVALHSQGPAMSDVESYLWALPHAAGPVTVLLLLGVQPAILFALCQALAAGLMLGGDFSVVVYSLTSGLVGALAAQQFKDRTGFTRVGVVVGVANLLALLVLELYRGLPGLLEAKVLSAVCALAGGPLSIGAATFALPLLEGLFGITTDIRLLELSNQNQPLLKRLSLEAPGTYQHSLSVGNLAEAGSEAVGANSLRIRVCAYYHDVGKMLKPEYFVENQRGPNPHDVVSPSMSALVIQSHIKEGLELARKAKLPIAVREAIATHHGTKLMQFFYKRAQERIDPEMEQVRESDYRYPGPKPRSKELGILLLADTVEAAARTLENPSPTKIQNMIARIFTDSLEDGQLDHTELTFSELDKIASAFMWVLTNMYHHRIDYPGFDFNRRQDRREPSPVQLGTKALAASG